MRRIAAARFSTQPSPLTKMLIPASKHYISNISNHSFTVSGQGGYQQVVNGPLAIVSNRILLWDAPQYGVGGSSNLNVDPANVNEIGNSILIKICRQLQATLQSKQAKTLRFSMAGQVPTLKSSKRLQTPKTNQIFWSWVLVEIAVGYRMI